ncbi:hypothetical protein QVD17_41673 [Tagetes erecta]|uniref:Uncharacterized protein n=1 Tax=Tagetes erecta TaxID=13708 RepID=A0AAD8JMY1_TARER|nr:hypothetical protein QVD17_41673 [Tagetes erecta]
MAGTLSDNNDNVLGDGGFSPSSGESVQIPATTSWNKIEDFNPKLAYGTKKSHVIIEELDKGHVNAIDRLKSLNPEEECCLNGMTWPGKNYVLNWGNVNDNVIDGSDLNEGNVNYNVNDGLGLNKGSYVYGYGFDDLDFSQLFPNVTEGSDDNVGDSEDSDYVIDKDKEHNDVWVDMMDFQDNVDLEVEIQGDINSDTCNVGIDEGDESEELLASET